MFLHVRRLSFWLTLLVLVTTACGGRPEVTPTTTAVPISASTATSAPTITASVTRPPTNTPTVTASPSPVPSETPTVTPKPSATATATATPHPLAGLPWRVVFSSYEGSDNAEIYVANGDGSGQQRLTNDDFFDFTPQPSPDGQRIAFSSDREGGSLQIYVMDIDGENLTRITNSDGNDRDPSWSADGQQLAFTSDRDGEPEIFVINLDGTGERQLTDNEVTDVLPLWSPDGQWIAFSSSEGAEGDPNIYIMRPDGSEVQRVTFSPRYDGDAATWSADSQWLIFPADRIGNYELYAVKVDGSAFGTLTLTAGNEFSGILSPDGRYLLMSVFYEHYTGVVVRDLANGQDYELTEADYSAGFATWLPAGTGEAFDSTWLTTAAVADEACVFSEDESYGYTADNPVPVGNGTAFGGPFDGVYAYTFLRLRPGEGQSWARLHTFPSNSQGDVLDTFSITTDSGESVTLYLNINDYDIPAIPVGLFCDLQLP
jgi:Tol biopolymer transport system component